VAPPRILPCAALALSLWGGPLPAAAGLLEAAASGDVESVRQSVAAREDLEARDERGWTALMFAAFRGHLDVARVLLEAGADVDGRAAEGSTPLMGAALSGHRALVELLLRRGADPTLANDSGATAQLKAEQFGHADLAALLGRASTARRASPAAPPAGGDGGSATTFEIEEVEDVYVLVEDATFRKLPSMGAPAAGQLPRGVAIRVTGKVRGRDWYRVGPATSSVFVPGGAIQPAPDKAPDKPPDEG